MTKFADRTIVGFVENIILYGNSKRYRRIKARIDTGAVKSSIDARLAAELHLGPIIRRKLVVSAHGKTIRPVMEAALQIGKRKMKEEFTIANRTHMKYEVLIGQNILRDGFLIDPQKKCRS